MYTWKVETEPMGSVGSKIVMACVSCKEVSGNVSLTGHKDAVEALIESLGRDQPLANSQELNLFRFVFVNKDGHSCAMAFECRTEDGLLTLHGLEQIENYASQKLGESVLAETWSIMARPPKIVPVGGDVVGGVRCDRQDPTLTGDFEHRDLGDENDAKLK